VRCGAVRCDAGTLAGRGLSRGRPVTLSYIPLIAASRVRAFNDDRFRRYS